MSERETWNAGKIIQHAFDYIMRDGVDTLGGITTIGMSIEELRAKADRKGLAVTNVTGARNQGFVVHPKDEEPDVDAGLNFLVFGLAYLNETQGRDLWVAGFQLDKFRSQILGSITELNKSGKKRQRKTKGAGKGT